MSRNTFLRGVAACAMLALAATPSAAKSGPVFTKLMDTSFVAPDGQLIFTIDRPQMAGTTVAYIGAGSVVFVGRDAAGDEGVYSVPKGGGKIVKLANYRTAIPGGPVGGYTTFNVNYSFCNLSISGNTVAFDAGNSGVYEVDTDGKNLARIADANTPATIHTFQVAQYLQPSISGKNIAYIGATVFGPYAVFDGPPDLAHALVVARRDKFDGLAYPVLSGKDIDFSAHLVFPNQGVYRAEVNGGKSVKIMDYNTKVPKGAPGTSFSSVGSLSNGANWSPDGTLNVVAASTTDGTNVYPGLFSSCKTNTLSKILTQGDTLDGVEDVGPGAGISNLVGQKDGSALGAILVAGFRYAAIYTVNLPGC